MTHRIKYPRTPHLPWSPGLSSDDKRIESLRMLEGREVVVTAKMDGENTTMYRDHVHARSVSSGDHPSRHWVKSLQARIGLDIPEGWRLCGENLYARHSIAYSGLPSYFMLFSVWDEQDNCLSWDETLEWAQLLGLSVVPTLYRGQWDEDMLRSLYSPELGGDECEGYVIRAASSFGCELFGLCVAKYVRAGHVQTDDHWMSRKVQPNRLKEQS